MTDYPTRSPGKPIPDKLQPKVVGADMLTRLAKEISEQEKGPMADVQTTTTRFPPEARTPMEREPQKEPDPVRLVCEAMVRMPYPKLRELAMIYEKIANKDKEGEAKKLTYQDFMELFYNCSIEVIEAKIEGRPDPLRSTPARL